MNKSREKTPTQGMSLFCFLADNISAELQTQSVLLIVSMFCRVLFWFFFFPRKSLMFLKHSTGTLESCEWTANTQKNLPICSSPFLFLWDPIFLYSLGELSSLVTDFALASSPAEKLSAEWPELVWEPLLCTPGLCWSKKKVHGLENQEENGHC